MCEIMHASILATAWWQRVEEWSGSWGSYGICSPFTHTLILPEIAWNFTMRELKSQIKN